MNISIFEVIGPVMIGPSSSHTAGAARLANAARLIAGDSFSKVRFGLHGSFAKTYKGHGTDKALVAGVLGIKEDDERLSASFELAKEKGLSFEFYSEEIGDAHENTVKISFYSDCGEICEIIGSSIGGGQILISRLNGMDIEFTAQLPTLLIFHEDKKGIVSNISHVMAEHDINIATMKLNRKSKGDTAYYVIEADDFISDEVVKRIVGIAGVLRAQAINLKPTEA